MKKLSLSVIVALALPVATLYAQEPENLQKELQQLKQEYEVHIKQLEKRLSAIETTSGKKANNTLNPITNTFNPAISLILDGRFASYKNDPEDYVLNGFPLAGEAGLAEEGFSIGHTELAISSNIDDKFYGKFTVAIADHDGETEIEVEEAFVQTLGLGQGMTAQFGRFFSAVGYLNEQHEHAWDFSDAPLIYSALFGNKLLDDGIQFRLVAPTDLFIEFGAEAFRGSRYPTAGEHTGAGSWSVFTHIGGDIGVSHSWQLGLSHWSADVEERQGSAHSHAEDEPEEIPSFTGDSEISALDFVYKWAPNGNTTQTNITLQFEYFEREERGDVSLIGSSPLEITDYDGNVNGGYAQLVYKFSRHWRLGVRYDYLDNNNQGSDLEVLDEAGLINHSVDNPTRTSLMTEWIPSEFSRIRLQFNQDKSNQHTDEQWLLHYTFSLGAHGAHQF